MKEHARGVPVVGMGTLHESLGLASGRPYNLSVHIPDLGHLAGNNPLHDFRTSHSVEVLHHEGRERPIEPLSADECFHPGVECGQAMA
ncbi:hypothetical protein D3C84_1134660 [compost metagenome]